MKNLMKNFLILFGQIVLVELALPPSWRTCDKNDPERNNCLTGAINEAIQSLLDGNKDLGFEPLDPLHFGRILTKGSNNGPVALELILEDLVIHNIKNVEVISAKFEGRTLELTAHNNGVLECESPYRMNGKILTFPITGEGNCNIKFWNGNYDFTIIFRDEPQVRDGKQYLVVDKFTYRGHPKKLEFHFENLFNGNNQLGENMNKVINDNWEVVRVELRPQFQDALSEGFLKLSNKVFSRIPMDEIGLF